MVEGLIESKAGDEVKRQYFKDFEAARNSLFLINKKRVQTPKATNFGGVEASFKAGVIKLYDACRVKFVYQKNSESVKKLQSIEKTIDFKISLKDAETVFKLLTDFLEADGVTKFEEDKHSSF